MLLHHGRRSSVGSRGFKLGTMKGRFAPENGSQNAPLSHRKTFCQTLCPSAYLSPYICRRDFRDSPDEEMSLPTTEEIQSAVAEQVEALFEDVMRDTARIISFETVSGGTEEQEHKYREQIPACLQWLSELAAHHGFHFRQWDNEVAEIEWAMEPEAGEGKRPVFGIASHIDVVTPVGNWTHGPFDGKVEDGIFYGRGAQDDKGPLIQALYGMIAVKKAGIRPPCDVRIIIGTHEETGDWTDIEAYLKERPAPDYCYTPDADFPVIIGEKGMMNLKVTAQWPRLERNPETGMEFLSFSGGERSNIVPALAEVLMRFPVEAKNEVMKELVRETTRFTVENKDSNITLVPNNEEESEAQGYYEALLSFVGKAAHSSTPDYGHNAILDGLKFFADIETLPGPVRSFIQFLHFASAGNDGANLGIAGTHQFVGDTTCVISLLDVGPEGGTANLNTRPTMGTTTADVLENAQVAAKAFTDATGLEIQVEQDGRAVDAIYLDPKQPHLNQFLSSLRQAYETVVGETCDMIAIGGTTYAKGFPNCCAFGPVLLGVDEGLAHQTDERMAVDSIKRNTLIYALSLAFMDQNAS